LRIRPPDPPVDIRLWRFKANDPATAAVAPTRLPGDSREPGRARVLLVVDERGRVDDETSFGSPGLALRAPEFGAPEARFRFLITSVLRDRGLTTPCNL